MLEPDYYCESVHTVQYDKLWEFGIRGLVFDIDNTLVAFDEEMPSQETIGLVRKLQSVGFKLCLLTNNTNRRLGQFNRNLQLPGFANAFKPLPFGLNKAVKLLGVSPNETAMIGDQLLSDVWAGKSSGTKTVLVKPITERDFWFVKIKRVIENRLLKKYYG